MDRPHSHASILYCSGQWWKLWAMVIATALALITLVAAEWFRESMSFGFNVLVVSLATAAAAGAIAYPCWSIRCPVCEERWFWLALTKQRAGNWFDWLQALWDCPKCHATCETIRLTRK